MRIVPGILLGAVFGCSAGHMPAESRGQLSVHVTDTVARIEQQISPGLRLEIRRDADVAGATAGWEIAVRADGDTTRSNLLYHSREWHGPYPSQVSAWSEAQNYFGRGARRLTVRGHPWLIVLRCSRCTTKGAGPIASFTAGELIVEWRRATE